MVPIRKRLSLRPRQLQLQSKHQLPPQNRMKDHQQRARIAISMPVLSWCPFSRNPLVEVANVLLLISKGTVLHLEKAKDHPRARRPGSAPESIAVFGPIVLVRFAHVRPSGYIFTVLKQFGTGVIISTAFIHLYTHADLMFANECLGGLQYEATTSAIVVAGAFLTFLLQYTSFRLYDARSRTVASSQSDMGHPESMNGDVSDKSSQTNVQVKEHVPRMDDPLSVLILEAGIIFHSAIIGVTLVVAGDSFYRILVVVIIFHQMFEGLALGVRISNLNSVPTWKKLLMASAFALITPLGMAIGLGALNSFNGNDRSTIIAIGTLDAFSAGILVWTGFVQMWSHDWMYGELRDAGAVQTGLGMFALVAGLVAMSVLGKWA
ncbi:MAG: hypothetical protein Q9185_006656 [Variospora sp. 1 TL-2023]